MKTTSHTVAETVRLLEEYRPTTLLPLPGLARFANVAHVYAKLENERPLGNFKFLGGMVAGMRALARDTAKGTDGTSASQVPRLICASDGNHGLSVAAAARRAGVSASIYLPESVGLERADRIVAMGGDIIRIRGTYDDAVMAAVTAAARGDGILVPDTADADNIVVRDVMEGYGVIAAEIVSRFDNENRPSHLFVQAGVGGLAAAMADGLSSFMQEPRKLVVVEPEHAACVSAALHAGRPVRIPGNLKTCAEMLSCGLASAPALEILLRHRAQPLLVTEDELLAAAALLAKSGGPETTPSGAAGLAGFLHVAARPE
ncbi:MAG: pyridoxal-phosphate dependent enzyme [Proteobacteria bacterium]|nr:pyridoxal-phosphate dependent enzyme [Pseudomonadota bacterium]